MNKQGAKTILEAAELVDVVTTKIFPSEVSTIARALFAQEYSFYLWGPPGIGKSDLLEQVATSKGIAYFDLRLATKNVTQLAGVPFPHEEHGEVLVKYSIPSEFPRDIDIDHIIDIRATPHLVRFSTHNPKGKNGIHYVRNPIIEVEALDAGLTAHILSSDDDRFVVVLRDAEGRNMAGAVRYRIEGKAVAIWVLDELSSAKPEVQAAAYSLVLDGRVGDYVKPAGVRLWAAGNRQNDAGVFYKMPKPLQNRFMHYELQHRWKDWDAHARTVGYYPAIVEFHAENEGKALFRFDPKSKSQAWPSPRSWTILSAAEYAFDAAGITDPRLRLAEIMGTIGEQDATAYYTFKKNMDKLPRSIDILSGTVTTIENAVPYSMSEQNFITLSLSWVLRNRFRDIMQSLGGRPRDHLNSSPMERWYEQANRALAFMTAYITPELVAGTIKSMSKNYGLPLNPAKMPAFRAYAKKHANLMA